MIDYVYMSSHHSFNVSIKNAAELDAIRAGGRVLATIVKTLIENIRPGMSTMDIEKQARVLISEMGGVSAFLNYRPEGVKKPYPASVCVSVNDEIVHGIPKSEKILQLGDIVTVDCGLKYRGYFTDHAVTTIVGGMSVGSAADIALIDATNRALQIGIDECVVGNTNLSAGRAIERFVNRRYGIVRELSGHGVGYGVHEDPFVPNFAMKSNKIAREIKLQPGMVLAIEPMLNIGSADVDFWDDEYTVATHSGKNAAHSEHTIIITENGPEVVTLC
jgi:methionyl aminopeptidase